MDRNFYLVEGVAADDLEGVRSAYYADVQNGCVDAVLSAELLLPLAEKAVRLLQERVFFFIELPCTRQREQSLRKNNTDGFHYDVYYLDGCTMPVAEALLKRYGELLVNDGICRFGFGSHESGEEIFFRDYQTVTVWGDTAKFSAVFDDLGVARIENFKRLDSNFSDLTPGRCSLVELNGETVYDILENLAPEGMYLADTLEEN